MRKSRGPQTEETRAKISAAHKRSGHRPDPSVVDLAKARRVHWVGNCDDCQGGYGVTCPEPPQDDHELFGHLYCTRHGCKLWREAY